MDTTLNNTKPSQIVMHVTQQVVHQHNEIHCAIDIGPTGTHCEKERGLTWWKEKMSVITTAANTLLCCYKVFALIRDLLG